MNDQSSIPNDPRVEHLRPLHCFLAVAEHLHFGRAAESLLLPQSTVSEQVKRLERQLGGDLLTRTSRRVSLTPLGELFLPDAERVMTAVRHAYTNAARVARTGTIPLLLATAPDVDNGELAATLVALRDERPDLTVTPQLLGTADQIEALEEQRLHLGYVWEPPEHPDLAAHHLGTTPMTAFVPLDHPLAKRSRIDLIELTDLPLVLFSPRANQWVRRRFDEICRIDDLNPLVVAETPGYDGQAALVLAGAGIGITAKSISQARTTPGLAHCDVTTSTGWRRALLHRHDATHPGIDTLRSAMQRNHDPT